MYYLRKFNSQTDFDNLDAYYPCLSVVVSGGVSTPEMKDVEDFMWYCFNDDFSLVTGKGNSDWSTHHNQNTDFLIDYHPRYGEAMSDKLCVGRWF